MIKIQHLGWGLLALMLSTGEASAQRKKSRPKRKNVQTTAPVKVKTNDSLYVPAASIAGVADARPANAMLLCAARNGMPVWYLSVVKDFRFPEGFMAPMNYKLLSVSESDLNLYLHSIPYTPSDKHVTIPLLVNGELECRDFQITRVETMDSALQAEYPELMSFVAREKGNSLNEARIDCDGTSTKISVRYDGRTYFVNPVMFNKKLFYATYTKDDPNFVKQAFER